MLKNGAYEDVIQGVQKWGELDISICYVLQTDLNTTVQDNTSVPIKFFVGAKNPDQLIQQTGWLNQFGSTIKRHIANHGFCCLVKAAYDTGLKLNFVVVNSQANPSGYSHYNLDKLDSNSRLLVKK